MGAGQEYQFTISVTPRYDEEKSRPHEDVYAFAYHIRIENTGEHSAQLISRRWFITDANENIQEVRGLGVVGHQPFLQPGQHFEYESWAVIQTPVGTMRGSYFFVTEDDNRFDAPIPEFTLAVPRSLH
jgi:ApaG protein